MGLCSFIVKAQTCRSYQNHCHLQQAVTVSARMRQIMTCLSLKSSLERLTDSGRRSRTAQGQSVGQGQGEEGESPEVLSCLHGLRVLSMLWVIQGHTHYFAAKVPSEYSSPDCLLKRQTQTFKKKKLPDSVNIREQIT